MATEFALWLSTQDILTQLMVYNAMIITMIIGFVINKKTDEIKEEKEFRIFVSDYFNGTLNYRGEQF